MRLRKMLGPGALLVAANIVGLVLNYAHQAQAASLLSPDAFGRFATWLGLVGIGLSLGLVAQLGANYFVFASRTFLAWRVGSAAVAAVLLGIHLLVGRSIPSSLLGFEAVALGVALSVSIGQYQARLSFGAMAFTAVVSFGVRALLPNLFSHPDEKTFYLATPIAVLVTLLALVPVSGAADELPAVAPKDGANPAVASKMAAAIVLAICGSSFPVIDVLMVARLAPAITAGHFAQAALFTRLPYFFGALLLQMTLPYHLRAARGAVSAAEIARLRKVEAWAILAVCLSAPLNAAVVPWLAARLLGVDLSMAPTWILVSTLDFGALLALSRGVQIQCAKGAVSRTAAVLFVAATALFGARWLSGGDVTIYLGAALVVYTVGALAVPLTQKRTEMPA